MVAEYDPMNEPDIRADAEQWTPPLDFTGVLQHQVGVSNVMMSARLLWPPFVEERGCVLLPWVDADVGLDQWWEPLGGDVAQIESMVNHLHLWDLFPDGAHETLVVLGETLVQTWSAALEVQFPARRFEVWLRNDEYDYGPTVYVRSADRPVSPSGS